MNQTASWKRAQRVAAWLAASLLLGCAPAPAPRAHLGLAPHGLHGGVLPRKTVTLTFDDGPDEHTRELAAFLGANDIHATFFINGRRLCKTEDGQGGCVEPMDVRACDDGESQAPVTAPRYYPESLLDELIALGHHLGNHSQDHCRLTDERSGDDMVFELDATQAILERHTRDGLFPFRPPYGDWNQVTERRARAAQSFDELVGPMLWDIDGQDWDCWRKGLGVEACGERYLKLLEKRHKQNGILLMHDRPEYNVGSLSPLQLTEWLVPQLQRRGYRFADIDELLASDDLLDPLPDDGQ